MISIEQLSIDVILLRFHPTGGYGDLYTFVVTGVLYDSNTCVKLCGGMGEFNVRVRRMIKAALQGYGIKHVTWERRKSASEFRPKVFKI